MVSQFRIDLYMNPLKFKEPQRAKNLVQRIYRTVSAPCVGSYWTSARLGLCTPSPRGQPRSPTASWLERSPRRSSGKKFGLTKTGIFSFPLDFLKPYFSLPPCPAPRPFPRRARRAGAVSRRSRPAGQPRCAALARAPPVPGGPAPSAGLLPQRPERGPRVRAPAPPRSAGPALLPTAPA